MPSFDASLDLTVRTVPAGVTPKDAVARVRLAVEALPGAGWISVEWCGDAPCENRWLRVWSLPDGLERWDGAWADVRERVTVVARGALGISTGG